MDSKFRELQKWLTETGIPEFVSFLPLEARSEELTAKLTPLNHCSLAEISNDNSLLPFISDYVGTPFVADLSAIAKYLEKYSEVQCDVFEKESTITARTTTQFVTAKSIDNGNDEYRKSEKIKPKCNVEDYIIERIEREILETSLNVTWDDIVGLEDIKRVITEIVVWPMQRPDVFTGLRGPPKGLLLFGPPGTGKTLIGKCIASQCKATFFSISASSLTSKWVGEGEKMVRALFYQARKMAPSVIFIDEIDSLLSQRSENENEGSRRIKTEFLVQFDGASVGDNDRILVIGATNRPQEIDEAARRRLVKRIYVPLPELESRVRMIKQLIDAYKHEINEEGLKDVGRFTEGYSGSDMFSLCREASMGPLREIGDIHKFDPAEARAINAEDFMTAMKQIRRSVSDGDLSGYVLWNDQFGSMRFNG